MKENTAKAMQTGNKEDGSFSMRLDNTTYVVGIHFNKTGKETLEDKVKRLIQRDVKEGNF